MDDPVIFLVIILVVSNIFLLLFLGHLLLLRPEFFFENVFPSKKPDKGQFWSKEPGIADKLVLYYGSRFFLLSAIGLGCMVFLRYIGFI